MKVFAITHSGVWPVGACSVVVANDQDHAIEILKHELFHAQGIALRDYKVTEIPTDKVFVRVILNGDY